MNDTINLAIREAVRAFGGSDNIFTLAALSEEICRIARLKGAMIDGRIVAVVLSGRSDVERLKGGCHYRLLEASRKTH